MFICCACVAFTLILFVCLRVLWSIIVLFCFAFCIFVFVTIHNASDASTRPEWSGASTLPEWSGTLNRLVNTNVEAHPYVTGLVKAVLVLQHEQATPNAQLTSLNPKIAQVMEHFPVRFPVELESLRQYSAR